MDLIEFVSKGAMSPKDSRLFFGGCGTCKCLEPFGIKARKEPFRHWSNSYPVRDV